MHARTCRVVLAGALACACEEPSEHVELPDPIWEGEHIRFRTEADAEICGGSFAYLDDYVDLLGQALEVHLDGPIDYYWIPGPLHGTPCEGNIGCYDDGVVYTGLIPHDHELVHATTSAIGRTDRGIMEGLAVLYGEDANGNELPMHAPAELIGSGLVARLGIHVRRSFRALPAGTIRPRGPLRFLVVDAARFVRGDRRDALRRGVRDELRASGRRVRRVPGLARARPIARRSRNASRPSNLGTPKGGSSGATFGARARTSSVPRRI